MNERFGVLSRVVRSITQGSPAVVASCLDADEAEREARALRGRNIPVRVRKTVPVPPPGTAAITVYELIEVEGRER